MRQRKHSQPGVRGQVVLGLPERRQLPRYPVAVMPLAVPPAADTEVSRACSPAPAHIVAAVAGAAKIA